MIIERVTKKDANNVIVHLDNNEKLFLSYEVFLKNGLRKNKEISDSLFYFLVEENKKYFIKKRALSLLARRVHSKNELRFKLWQKKYDSQLVEEVLNFLEENEILNDKHFSEIFTEEKIKNSKWGISKIKAELFKRGVDRNIIEEVINDFFPDGNELENALIVAKKKLKSLNNQKIDKRKKKQKLLSHLASKGYDFSTGLEVVEKLIKDD